ncbi:MAG: hypothetical protein ABJQ29_11575 [Luteolibacter sp.]
MTSMKSLKKATLVLILTAVSVTMSSCVAFAIGAATRIDTPNPVSKEQ